MQYLSHWAHIHCRHWIGYSIFRLHSLCIQAQTLNAFHICYLNLTWGESVRSNRLHQILLVVFWEVSLEAFLALFQRDPLALSSCYHYCCTHPMRCENLLELAGQPLLDQCRLLA
jgi:hypothetical protein